MKDLTKKELITLIVSYHPSYAIIKQYTEFSDFYELSTDSYNFKHWYTKKLEGLKVDQLKQLFEILRNEPLALAIKELLNKMNEINQVIRDNTEVFDLDNINFIEKSNGYQTDALRSVYALEEIIKQYGI
jgi:hypothetical protein